MFLAYYAWVNAMVLGDDSTLFLTIYAVLGAISLFVGTIMFFTESGPFYGTRDWEVAGVWATATVIGGFFAVLVFFGALPFILGAGAIVGLAWISVKVWEAAKGE